MARGGLLCALSDTRPARCWGDAPFWDLDAEVLRQLVRLAGDDPTPVAPWERDAMRFADARRRVVSSWIRWWRSHAGDTPAQRAAAGESLAVADLTHADPAVRFAAMQRLVSVPARRAAVADATRALLADDNLPARAATHIARWARRNRLPLPPSAAPTTLARR